MVEAHKVFSELEAKVDISKFVFRGVNFWPVLKSSLSHLIYLRNLPSSNPKGNTKVFKKQPSYFTLFISIISDVYRLIRLRKLLKHQSSLLLSRPKYLINTKQGYVDKHLGFLNDLRSNSCVLVYFSRDEAKIHADIAFNDLMLVGKLVSKLLGVVKKHEEIDIPIEVRNQPLFAEFNFEFFQDNLMSIYGLSEVFDFIFDGAALKCVEQVCFYDYEHYAVTKSARKKGLIVKDLQHGNLLGHGAYHFFNVKEYLTNERSFLPTEFAVWSDAERNEILRMTDGALSATVNNDAWPARMKNLDFELNHSESSLAKIMAKFDTTCLISLQDVEFDWCYRIESLVKRNPDKIFIARLHPSKNNLSRYDVIASKHDNIKFYLSDSIRLPIILPKVNLHVTRFSSVAIESASYLVPTFFLDKAAQRFYEPIIGKECIKSEL